MGYAAVGTTMFIAGRKGVPNADLWKGHGAALILQGAGLFVLDGVAYLASRQRLGALVDLVDATALTVTASGVGIVVGL